MTTGGIGALVLMVQAHTPLAPAMWATDLRQKETTQLWADWPDDCFATADAIEPETLCEGNVIPFRVMH